MSHTCDAFVVTCIDFRFQKYIKRFTDTTLKGKLYDMVGFAGVTKDLPTIMNQLGISVRLHHTKKAIFIHHEDCGAYGKESTYKRHVTDLHQAKKAVRAKYPTLIVDLYYLHLDGKFEKVS